MPDLRKSKLQLWGGDQQFRLPRGLFAWPTPPSDRSPLRHHHLGLRGDVVVADTHRRRHRCDRSSACRAEVLVLERTGGWGAEPRHWLVDSSTWRWNAVAEGVRVRGLGREHEDVHEAALGPGTDDTKIDAYCEGSVDHYNWLVDAGVPFKESFWGQPGWEPPYDDGLMYSGGENAAPFNTLVDPAPPRGHVPQMSEKNTGEKGGGYMLMKPLVETAEKLGVRAEYDLRVQTVVVDGDRVVGVVAKRYGKDVAIRARKGVVLAMGSFAYNNEMVRSNAPRIFGHPAAPSRRTTAAQSRSVRHSAPTPHTWTPPRSRSSATRS